VLNPSSSTYAGGGERPKGAVTLQARKQQLVRDAILDAAIELFIQKGFDETTVDDIAESAGVSRRSFFRYFSSKNDLMTHGIVNYGTSLTEAIQACPPTDSLSEIFRETVRKVAKQSAAGPRVRKIMRIAAKYPAAREAQLSGLAEVQDQVADAFARRCELSGQDDPTPHLLAGLTLSILSTTFRSWFYNGGQDISTTVDNVLATLACLACNGETSTAKPTKKSVSPGRKRKRKRV
jgi:AcrR family transcriptional regulator